MAITFKHDAAAIIPPSDAGTRKYGQSLVMQQQQQKYQAQQAANDRMFDAYRQQSQNQFQVMRDQQQNQFQVANQNLQNQFQTDRDKALFEQRQQMAEQDRQRAFMDDARKMSSGMIMADIENGHYDSATAMELKQNLIDEAQALGNPKLDATQRANILEQIRARRLVLKANRMEKPPAPTATDRFYQGIVTGPDGTQYRENSKGDFDPLPQQKQRPSSAAEAFDADPKLADKYMQHAKDIVLSATDENGQATGESLPLTEARFKEITETAKRLWENENLPKQAPESPVQSAPQAPGEMQSILEPAAAPPMQMPQQAPGEERSILDQPINNTPKLAPEMGSDRKPYSPEQSILEQPPAPAPTSQSNPWAEIAEPAPAPAQSQQPTPAPPQSATSGKQPGSAVPDFGQLESSAQDDADKRAYRRLGEIYTQHKSPEVKTLISVLVDPNASGSDRAAAVFKLKEFGIDVNSMQELPQDGNQYLESNWMM